MIGFLRKKEAELSKKRRFKRTLEFVNASIQPPCNLLDIGTPNALSEYFKQNGYEVQNTIEKDLDLYPEIVHNDAEIDAVTAFEILEHLVNPMGVLKEIPGNHLFVSVPLRLWFSKAYRNPNNRWDQHYHEFEDWQFDWLLEKSGWEIVRSEKWKSLPLIPGFRPILRCFTPRFYVVEARKRSVSS